MIMRYLGFFLLLCVSLLQATPVGEQQQIPLNELVPLSNPPEAQFAFLCLNNGHIAPPDALKKSLIKWFRLKSANEVKNLQYRPSTRSFAWTIGRSRFVATQELLPIPKDDILYAANNSLHWPGADAQIILHKAHFTVTCTSIHRTPWHAALDLTHALAALAETHDTTGVYWGDASIIHSPESFLHQANYYVGAADTKIPGALWIGILFESDKAGHWNIFTNGFEPLDYKDIEIHGSGLKRSELLAFVDQVKQHVLSQKITLIEGLKLKAPDGNEWQVSQAKSILGNEKLIWLLTPQK